MNADCNHLEAFFDGELSSEQQNEFRAHLEQCETCRTRLNQLTALRASIRHQGEVSLSHDADLRLRRRIHREIRPDNRLPEILDIESVAQLMQLSVSEVAEILDEIPHFEIAGRIRFRRNRVLDWLREKEHTTVHKHENSRRNHGNQLIQFPGGSL